MKFFVDTADTKEIKELADIGLLDGVTTNPSLIAKSGRDFQEVIAEICTIVEGPVSAEVTALDADGMVDEGRKLAKIAKNVTVKVPLTLDGLKACRTLRQAGTMVNVTLCFSANQALLAAKAGATFISPFIGRLDDINLDGMELIREIRQIYDNYDFDTEILAASIRTPNHVQGSRARRAPMSRPCRRRCSRAWSSIRSPTRASSSFLADWKKTGQKILLALLVNRRGLAFDDGRSPARLSRRTRCRQGDRRMARLSPPRAAHGG